MVPDAIPIRNWAIHAPKMPNAFNLLRLAAEGDAVVLPERSVAMASVLQLSIAPTEPSPVANAIE